MKFRLITNEPKALEPQTKETPLNRRDAMNTEKTLVAISALIASLRFEIRFGCCAHEASKDELKPLQYLPSNKT